MRSFTQKHKRRGNFKSASFAMRAVRYYPQALTVLAVIILISSMVNQSNFSGTRVAVTDGLTPVMNVLSQPFRFLAEAIGGMTGVTQLRAENDRLKAENDKLKEWYQTALLLRAENQSLKDLLNVIPEPEQSYISTKVIGDSGTSFVKSVLIKAGANDGVKDGQAVLGSKGMIGRVIEVGNKASRVLLLNDISSHVPVIIEGANQKAILAGNNSDILTLEHLPPNTLIEAGARVITSGHGDMFPQGLPIGETVKTITGDVVVKAYTDPSNVDYVQIIEKPDDVNVRESIINLTTVPEQGTDTPNTAKTNPPVDDMTGE